MASFDRLVGKGAFQISFDLKWINPISVDQENKLNRYLLQIPISSSEDFKVIVAVKPTLAFIELIGNATKDNQQIIYTLSPLSEGTKFTQIFEKNISLIKKTSQEIQFSLKESS